MKKCKNCKYCIKEYWRYEWEFRAGSEIRICQQEDVSRARKLTILRISSNFFVIIGLILICVTIIAIEGDPTRLRNDIIDIMGYIYDYYYCSEIMPWNSMPRNFSLIGLTGMSFRQVLARAGGSIVALEDKKYIVGLWRQEGSYSRGIIITFRDKTVVRWEVVDVYFHKCNELCHIR